MRERDEFDDMQRRLRLAGVSFPTALELSEDCRMCCDALRYSKSERKQVSLMVSQAYTSGTLTGDELRSLRENAPFINLKGLFPVRLEVDNDFLLKARRSRKAFGSYGDAISKMVASVFASIKGR